jgi:hypothetical protein
MLSPIQSGALVTFLKFSLRIRSHLINTAAAYERKNEINHQTIMKANRVILPIATLLSATVFFATPVFSQQGIINPLTGLPQGSPSPAGNVSPATGLPGNINPATGLPFANSSELTPTGGLMEEAKTSAEVEQLIFNGEYDKALERCLAVHDKYKTGVPLTLLLRNWTELGRRFPKAKAALLEIRDQDVREFAQGRGYSDLFREISDINAALNKEDATYALFKSFRDKDPDLARQCYPWAEGALLSKGDYQWLYEHAGDPQAKFNGIRQAFSQRLESGERLAAQSEATRQRVIQINQQRGITNVPAVWKTDASATLKKSAENSFIGQTRRLIEILVGSGHKAEAERIRDQAVAVMDDPRLRSAVSDAEEKIKK